MDFITRELYLIENLLITEKNTKLTNSFEILKKENDQGVLEELLKELKNINSIEMNFHIRNVENLLKDKHKDNWYFIILCERQLRKVKEAENKEWINYFNYCLLNYRQDKLEERREKLKNAI